MEFFQVPGIFKDSICRAREDKNGVYTISLNAVKIGSIVKENGGWRLLEQLKEELSAENVQLIGQRIDERNH